MDLILYFKSSCLAIEQVYSTLLPTETGQDIKARSECCKYVKIVMSLYQ